tara:strand:- start:641 stop:841 length:201 start_codon:yes stop_codon:yes gene_type:complete
MSLKNKYKFHWNKETLDHFKFHSCYQNREETVKEITEFVENGCSLEDGETDEMLINDLIKQVYNEK